MPITEEDKLSEMYEKGVSCPHCHEKYSKDRKARFAERERQVELARARGEEHIGSSVLKTVEKRRKDKQKRREAAASANNSK
jgi:UPF0176 protein